MDQTDRGSASTILSATTLVAADTVRWLEERCAGPLASDGAIDVTVDLSSADWFYAWEAIELERRLPLRLTPRLVEPTASGSLLGLRADELACVRHQLWSWVRRPAGTDDGDTVSGSGAWHAVLATLLDGQSSAAIDCAPDPAFLPATPCAVLRDEAGCLAFLDGLLQIYAHPAVERCLEAMVGSDSFAREAAARPSLRLAALWLAATFAERDRAGVLREIYRDPRHAAPLLGAELDAVRGSHLEPAWRGWIRQFALDVPGRSERYPGCRPAAAVIAAATAPRSRPALEPDVTVVIPSFRHRAFVGRAVESALAQTAGLARVLVVDDGSDDGTAQAAAAIADDRVVVRSFTPTLGLGRNLDRALAEIDTPLFAILNSDDLFHPERLERCRRALHERPEAALVATAATPIDEEDRVCRYGEVSPVYDGRRLHDWLRWYEDEARFDRAPARLLDRLLAGNFLLSSSNLFGRVELLRATRERWIDLEFSLDWQLLLDAASDDRLIVLPEPLLAYRLHASNTVWFDAERGWRYYLETCQVAARFIEARWDSDATDPATAAVRLAEAMAGPLAANSAVDGEGLAFALMLDRCGLTAGRLAAEPAIAAAARGLYGRHQARERARRGGEHDVDRRDRRQADGTERARDARARAFEQRLAEAKATLDAALDASAAARAEVERAHAVAERDRALAQRESALAAAHRDELAAESSRRAQAEAERDQARAADGALRDELAAAARERDALLRSEERRLGGFLLGRLRLRAPLRAFERAWCSLRHHAVLGRLRLERRWPRREPRRAMAAMCWNFPIYSQTFVYQELVQLAGSGYALRHSYSILEPKDHLAPDFSTLWRTKRRLVLHPAVQSRDFERFHRRDPSRVARLIELLARESGLDEQTVRSHANVREGFSFARMVEAWGAHYLHSYFFYDRSLHALIAAWLLDLPRGISCYADHQLSDYELKLVPLQLRLCDLVIATSERIRGELMAIAPDVDPDKIVVKPNAIDARRFPLVARAEPRAGEPYRLVTVSRLEPKKGLTHLVDAVRLLREKGMPVELHLVGDADRSVASQRYRERLERMVDAHRLRGVVHLEGRRDQDGVRRLLALSHLFVAPFVETESGDKDGIPTSLLESMATGVAVVATDAGSIAEVIDDGRNGVLVPQRDAPALVAAIESLLADHSRRGELGRAAAATVRRSFDVESCERRFHERIDLVLARRSAAPVEVRS